MIAVVGDMQPTLWVERFFLGRPQLDWVRASIQRKLLALKPDLLVLNGDLTALGSSGSQWKKWDRWAEPLLASGIRVLPVMGNHDYFIWPALALPKVQARFPTLQSSTHYSWREKQTALIVLDSNRKLAEQKHWLKHLLSELEGDREVKWIHLFSHHSPLRNKNLTDHQSLFLKSRKTVSWVSGHEHSWTWTRSGEKSWIIWGGGGGPPHGPGSRLFGFLVGEESSENFQWKAVYVNESDRISGFSDSLCISG